MSKEGFDLNRSQVSADALATFITSEINEDLKSVFFALLLFQVPGIGPKAIENLAKGDVFFNSLFHRLQPLINYLENF